MACGRGPGPGGGELVSGCVWAGLRRDWCRGRGSGSWFRVRTGDSCLWTRPGGWLRVGLGAWCRGLVPGPGIWLRVCNAPWQSRRWAVERGGLGVREGFYVGVSGGMREIALQRYTCKSRQVCVNVGISASRSVCVGIQLYSNCWSALCYHVAPPSRRALHNALTRVRRQLRELVYFICAARGIPSDGKEIFETKKLHSTSIALSCRFCTAATNRKFHACRGFGKCSVCRISDRCGA